MRSNCGACFVFPTPRDRKGCRIRATDLRISANLLQTLMAARHGHSDLFGPLAVRLSGADLCPLGRDVTPLPPASRGCRTRFAPLLQGGPA